MYKFIMSEANIIDVTLDGRGVADVEGKVVFVPFTITGEKVAFERRKKKKKFDEANLVEVLSPVSQRITPRCEYFMRCGGCSMQHINAQAQIDFKQKSVLDTLRRIGNVVPARVYPPVVDKVWGYRRRARLAVKYVAKKGRALVGFREYGAPYVTDMWHCEVLHPDVARLIAPLSDLISGFSIKDKVPQVECSVADSATALVFRILTPLSPDDQHQLEQFAQQYQVSVYLQSKGPDTVVPLNQKTDPVLLQYCLPPFDITMNFLPIDFIQVHNEINQKMVRQAVDWLSPDSADEVLDLFCGLGNFSLPVAKFAKHVLGIEGDEALVERARVNARNNGLENVAFQKENLFEVDAQCEWLQRHWDKVVIDPPRAGAREVIELLAAMLPKQVLYVSCHPGTLARDADHLVNTLGYQLDRVSVLNMFPHTGHVETMALFTRKR